MDLLSNLMMGFPSLHPDEHPVLRRSLHQPDVGVCRNRGADGRCRIAPMTFTLNSPRRSSCSPASTYGVAYWNDHLVLINIPGNLDSHDFVDGYQMALKGRAGAAHYRGALSGPGSRERSPSFC
jgi:hypothetical protein